MNKANGDGHTLLYWAAYNGHPEMVRLLLDNKANKKLADKVGQKPLDMACLALPVGMTREKKKAEITETAPPRTPSTTPSAAIPRQPHRSALTAFVSSAPAASLAFEVARKSSAGKM